MKKKLKNNNNQKQVIYLICSPLSVRDYERFGISNWINANWKVKVFDITKFLLPKFWLHTNGDRNSFKFQGLTIFSNVKDILSTINKIKDKAIFIDMLGFSYTESKIRKAAITNGKVVRINLGTIPKFQPRKNILEILTLIINPIKLTNKIFQFLNNKIHQNRAKKYHPDYLVVGGLNSIKKFDKEKTSLIKAHNLDYDFFIKEKQIASNKDCNFLVFLDEDGPYHSDFIRFGVESYIKPKNYYPVIDLGLIKIAKLLKLNIKIAAHPRSSYSTKKIKYKHPIIENNTFELIRNSSVVVAHSSTAIQWAVIMKKPIIIVTTDEIQKSQYAKTYSNLIEGFAKSLGNKVLNLSRISEINNLKDYLYIDDKKYEKFIQSYVKMSYTPKKLTWDIVIENIESDLLF